MLRQEAGTEVEGGGVDRCRGSLVVRRDGTPAFCTAGCRPVGTAQALVTHSRFVTDDAVATVIGTDSRFQRALTDQGRPPCPR